jgi:short-subunit dehydrogenase
MQLQGRNVVLTGASHGIGLHIADALARAGANLLLAARSADELAGVAERARERGVQAVAVPTDVALSDQRLALIERAQAELGSIDVLVNNAAVESVGPFDTVSPEQLEREVAVNLLAPMALTRLVLPGMLDRGSGHLVNISSLAGLVAPSHAEGYAATKAGLIGFTRSLRREYRGRGVGFSVVCPGFVAEGMWARHANLGVRAPQLVGVIKVEKVADAVVSAIVDGSSELVVTPRPMRPLLAAAALSPSFADWVYRFSGAAGLYREMSQRESPV